MYANAEEIAERLNVHNQEKALDIAGHRISSRRLEEVSAIKRTGFLNDLRDLLFS